MKTMLTLILFAGFVVTACKKDAHVKNTGNNVPEVEHKVPVPAPVDTLVAAPKSDTVPE